MQKKVIISGVSGQDGSYMAEYCLELGHHVFGIVRRTAQIHDSNFKHLYSNPNFKVLRGDLTDGGSLDSIVQDVQPDYFVNFAAQSFVGDSWKIPEETFMVGAVGVLKCLEAIRKYAPACRFYNAGSSEQFGDVVFSPQNERHPFRPRSVYGAAKCAAHHLVKVYRESYNLYAVQGLLFNHESERRGEEFVTRKITKGVARIKLALDSGQRFEPIVLGNLSAKRDWSHAKDFVDGIWKMLNQDFYFYLPWDIYTDERQQIKYLSTKIRDYVLSSNETHTIAEFIERAFTAVDIPIEDVNPNRIPPTEENPHQGRQINFQTKDGQPVVVVHKDFYRPAEVDLLWGDSTLARKELGWNPKISFDNLVNLMVASDLNEAKKASSTQ